VGGDYSWLVRASIEYGTVILLAALGEIYAERSGVLNLGVEGMMALGAAVAVAVSVSTGSPWLGLAAAAAAAAALSLVHAALAVYGRANQVVSGLAITAAGLGASSLVGSGYVGLRGNPIEAVVRIPALERVPLLGGLSGLDPVSWAAVAAAVALWLVLFKTGIGLKIRAVGEDPAVAESLGHDVKLVRLACVLFGGAMAGLAGSHLTLVVSPGWFEGVTAGRGWLALGIVIFSSWNPLRALLLSYFFGCLMYLRFVLAPYLGVGGVLLKGLPFALVVVALAALSVESLRRRVGAPESLGKPYPPD